MSGSERARMRVRAGLVTAVLAVLVAAAVALGGGRAEASRATSTPIRAIFYYPWFPGAWRQQGMYPFTHYHPTLGYYDGTSRSVIDQHLAWIKGARLNALIASWWGPGSSTDQVIPKLLGELPKYAPLKLALYYEIGSGVPSQTKLKSDLAYISSHYAGKGSFLHVGGKPVLFVYEPDSAGCSGIASLIQANAGRFYLDPKVFPGFRNCSTQPQSWHQYGPAVATTDQKGYAYTVSPGFWKATESSPRLARDLTQWAANTKAMVASHEPWQLVTTFNEWGEGTSVEPASDWGTQNRDTLKWATGGSLAPPRPGSRGSNVRASVSDPLDR
jgi:hypothetical protein